MSLARAYAGTGFGDDTADWEGGCLGIWQACGKSSNSFFSLTSCCDKIEWAIAPAHICLLMSCLRLPISGQRERLLQLGVVRHLCSIAMLSSLVFGGHALLGCGLQGEVSEQDFAELLYSLGLRPPAKVIAPRALKV